ncbi:hypothetical protein P5V63_21645 [Mycobacteroides abscessus subsp. abscessus]|uniref:Uncharacterized protein n=1 Tax=Mycobacteroides abscessus subsp. abscessus TaxID=1185650 RepID=A0AB38CST8_9MYCO|nr:hypothetical protein [Mycobacteroides abscessus]AMU62817.1 hypothetical protein A3O03_24030 [Mycobacteroides abscessus]MDM2600684.1 hypothetical protein [Mycobacteroides abscessus]MDM2612807.1 hypothetical protein [Mycobacteroides abscessus]MDM2617799.1 hypothetical protein [Mycobacteroides abscessus]MDM2622610.1 hypothetical protein [Mycobacteroides abscessus]
MTTRAKVGRFYEIMAEVGEAPYVLTADIKIPRMGIDARDEWRKNTYLLLVQRVLDGKIINEQGRMPETVDYAEKVERALLGEQYDACKALFADNAAAWDKFLAEVRDYNMVDGTESETDAGKDASAPAE